MVCLLVCPTLLAGLVDVALPDLRTGRTLAKVIRRGNLDYLESDEVLAAFYQCLSTMSLSSKPVPDDLWHHRLAHTSDATIAKLHRLHLISISCNKKSNGLLCNVVVVNWAKMRVFHFLFIINVLNAFLNDFILIYGDQLIQHLFLDHVITSPLLMI